MINCKFYRMHNDVIYVDSAVDSCYETAKNQSMQRYIKKLLSITNISQLPCQFKAEQMNLNSASTEGRANFI